MSEYWVFVKWLRQGFIIIIFIIAIIIIIIIIIIYTTTSSSIGINCNWVNLMFFWPCIMNWLYINYQLDALIIIHS